MWAQDVANGISPLDQPPAPPPGPVVNDPPVPRVEIPEANWREEQEAARRPRRRHGRQRR
jgi:hypothetical protein